MPTTLQVKTLHLKFSVKLHIVTQSFYLLLDEFISPCVFDQSYNSVFYSSPIYKTNYHLSFIHIMLQNTALFWRWEIVRWTRGHPVPWGQPALITSASGEHQQRPISLKVKQLLQSFSKGLIRQFTSPFFFSGKGHTAMLFQWFKIFVNTFPFTEKDLEKQVW